MKSKLSLTSFQLKNFKAVQDSKVIKFTPLTTFIGNNGSGKSSIVEALETLQTLVLHGIDEAMHPWHGFEFIWNMAKEHKTKGNKITNPMTFVVQGIKENEKFRSHLEVVAEDDFNKVFFQKYKASYASGEFLERPSFILKGEIADPKFKSLVEDWQFFRLTPQSMTEPVLRKRSHGKIKLEKNGANIADYLLSIRDQDTQAFNGIVETLKFVLPFAVELRPVITSELERKVFLMLSEDNVIGKLPGWLLSTGTLRILTILAVLRHPNPPPVVIIEEIENGLDPRTVHLLVDEIRYFVESGYGQIIFTTHSPYLLDLLPLSPIIVVDRDDSGSPQFTRPSSQKELKDWTEEFTPGKMYSMGTLTRS